MTLSMWKTFQLIPWNIKGGLLANCCTTCLNVQRMWHIKAMGKQKNKQPQPTTLTKQEAQTNMVDFDHKFELNVLI